MMTKNVRRLASYSLVIAVAGGAFQAGCGGDNGASTFDLGNGENEGGPFGDGGALSDATLIQGDDGGGFGSDAPVGTLVIAPANAIVSVTIDSAGVHATPLPFTATLDGSSVTPTWSFDRGELGSIAAATGIFSASGKNAGAGTVTAHYGNAQATATVTVQIHSVQNGGAQGDAGAPDSGAGGAGGVGGEGLGGSVDSATVGRLRAGTDAGTSASDLALLYPYDKTVWPRGILAPLVQWTTSHTASAVYIHVTQKNFEFEGFYSGTSLVHQPIDQTAWAQATNGNGGDPMHIAITIADGANVWGPVSEDWIVAPGVLKGTVYYNSYNTKLATPVGTESQAAAVLAIKPGSSDPTLAIPGTEKKCIVCHTLSDDGQTLWAQDGQLPQGQTTSWPDYNNGTAYDMKNGGAPIASYTGTAPDGTTNDRKFLWSGPSPDGTFALQSSGHTQETYGANTPGTPNLDSRVFRRADGNAVTSTGLDGVVREAVTPAFSRDGKHVAFNFWSAKGSADAGIPAGNGHTLDLMDFACGAFGSGGGGDGGPSCSTFAFSNMRRLYTNASANGYPAWPAWLPDGSGIVFHNTVAPGSASPISTWHGAKAEQWFVDVPTSATATPQPIAMNALNGKNATGTSYLPTNGNHPDDTILNYEPTINPIASGGYYWVVFTSRRMYGNVANGDPYAVGNGTSPVTKKLWVSAIDLHPTPGKDPSHPAFYLPGQEINAPNMRGFWVVDPCRPNGNSCETGDECCNGFCREPGDGGALQCTDAPVGCANEFENCTTNADCCGASSGFQCLNGRCARPTPK